MAGLSQGSEAAVAASPKPAVAVSPEDLASLRVSQPLKLSNVPLKWIRDSCEDPGSHRGEAIVAAVAAEGTEGADDDRANEANVATVAAGDTAGAEGAVSDVSSDVFCPLIEDRDPVAEADLMDYEEFVAEHGDDAVTRLLFMRQTLISISSWPILAQGIFSQAPGDQGRPALAR